MREDASQLEDAVKVIYDKQTDTLSIILRPGKVAESDEPRTGLILDYDSFSEKPVSKWSKRVRSA